MLCQGKVVKSVKQLFLSSVSENVKMVLTPKSKFKKCFILTLFSFLQEKQERAIGLLVSLGPQPGSEVTPWYLKTSKEKEEIKEKEKRKGVSEEEREKKDRRLKDSLDPLKDMKKALAVKDRKEHKSKKKEKRDKGEKSSADR